ncbi:MAG: tetratricopeptide repeat protein [Gemmatimonadales bacterium]
MKPIFISYSSKHRDLTRELARMIEAQYGAGSVWWDHELESRGSYAEQIRAALEEARVVVVIWAAGAMVSDYVYAEAVSAQQQGKLVNVRPADMRFQDIPQPFNVHHIDDIGDQEGILVTIAKVMHGTPIPTRVPLHEIYYRQYGHRLIDPKQERVVVDPREVAPTELLQARLGVVDYIDVTGLEAKLIGWCTDGAQSTSGRLIHGPGGLGKTRLMIEVAAKLRQKGWMAGFLPRPHDQTESIVRQRWQALDQLIAGGEDEGLLIIMDYAEARRDEVRQIAERLSRRPVTDPRPIRLVLLARSASDWWTALHDELHDVQRVFRGTASASGVIELPSVADGRQRLELFKRSREAFAPYLAAQGYPPPTGHPSPERLAHLETGTGFTRPLAIQMDALLWLASSAPETGVPSVETLLRRVLGLERNHWKKLVGDLDDERARDMARGVAQVTAVQGVPSRAATERLLMADEFYGDRRKARVAVDPVARDLSRVYGRSDGGIAHLEPDLLGEHHVAMEGDIELIDGCLRWIEAESDDTREKRRRDLLTVLQRATQPEHGPGAIDRAISLLDHLVGRHLKALAADMVAIMVDTPGALADRLQRAVAGLDEEALRKIDEALPLHSLSLMELSQRVADRLVTAARERLFAVESEEGATESRRETVLNRLAVAVGTFGIRLSNLGRREEALAASQEAVDINRRLAQARPDAFLPDLAMSLNNLGIWLSNLGRHEEALAASQEAVDLRRRLAQARPDAFLPGLAMSLHNLGGDLSDLGRREEALAVSQEAVDLYRRFAQTRPDAFLPDLARSLNNLGIWLSHLGRREEALAVSQEAVDLYRRLAQTRPDAILPGLASGLSNLGNRLGDLGRREEALAASQEAVDIRRRLAQARPDAFLPDLAVSLHNLGGDLSHLGRREEALAASQEAVDLRRRLAQARPDAFLPDLAMSLNNLGNRLGDLGHREEALAASQEAVDIRRRLAQARPDAFLPHLAMSLDSLGNRLGDLGHCAEAFAASQEAVDIFRRLAQTRPDAFFPDLASSLNSLGNRLRDLGHREEALVASQEAVDIFRRLAQARPDASLPDLATSLNNTGAMLSNLGRREEALAASQEAADIRRHLAQARPDAFLPDLATSISVTSEILAELDWPAEAARAAHEALRILAPFVERYPDRYGALARTICADVVRYCDAAAQAPDHILLERIARALRREGSG